MKNQNKLLVKAKNLQTAILKAKQKIDYFETHLKRCKKEEDQKRLAAIILTYLFFVSECVKQLVNVLNMVYSIGFQDVSDIQGPLKGGEMILEYKKIKPNKRFLKELESKPKKSIIENISDLKEELKRLRKK